MKLDKRIITLTLSVIMLLSCFLINSTMLYAEDVETIADTTETKTTFTVEELLELGFVSTIDYSSIHLKSIYNISQSKSVTNFDTALFLYSNDNVKYHITDKALDTDSDASATAPLFVLFEYYTYSDSDYNYYSNYSREYSIYPLYQKRLNTIISTSTDFTSYHTMKNVVDSDKIIIVREKKSDKTVDYLMCNYTHYKKYHANSSLSDIFKSCCIIDVPDFYRVSFSNNSTDNNVSTEKNYQLWGVVLRSKEEIQAMKQSFMEWFIANNKIEYLIGNGINVSLDHVSYLFDWWNNYGDNPITIALNLPKLLSNVNVISWDVSLAKRMVDCFENLYLQYQEYVAKLAYGETRPVQGSTNYMPHHRKENSDDTIVTDTEEDTTLIIILREIVRILIDLPESIRLAFVNVENRLNAVLVNMNNIVMYLDMLPDYIANSITNNLNIDDINLKIDDISIKISDLIDIFDVFPDIPQNIIDDYIDNIDVLYEVEPENNPIVEFEDKITEKFPIIEQSQQIISIEQFISEENKTPLITMKNPALLFDSDKSNDILLADSNNTSNEITVFDFSKFDDVLDVIKNVLAFFIIIGFGHWLINYIPKLLAGYNESD